MDEQDYFQRSGKRIREFLKEKKENSPADRESRSEEGDPVSEIWPSLIRFLTFRDRSAKEVKDFLLKKRLCPASSVPGVLESLRAKGLLDDLRFSRNRCDYRMRNGYGPLHIRRELQEAGVPRPVVEEVLGETEEEPFLEGARDYLSKKDSLLTRSSDPERKATELLLRRGFTSSQVRRVVGSSGFHEEFESD